MLSDNPVIEAVFAEASAEALPFAAEVPWATIVAALGAEFAAGNTR